MFIVSGLSGYALVNENFIDSTPLEEDIRALEATKPEARALVEDDGLTIVYGRQTDAVLSVFREEAKNEHLILTHFRRTPFFLELKS